MLWFWLGCGFWHNSHVSLIPTFPSLSFLMTQADSNAGDSQEHLQPPRGHLSLRLPGCFPSGGNNSSPASRKAVRIKRSQKPIENNCPQTQCFATQLSWCTAAPRDPPAQTVAPCRWILHMWSPPPVALITSGHRWVGNSVAHEPDFHQRSLPTAYLFLEVSYTMLANL